MVLYIRESCCICISNRLDHNEVPRQRQPDCAVRAHRERGGALLVRLHHARLRQQESPLARNDLLGAPLRHVVPVRRHRRPPLPPPGPIHNVPQVLR